MARTPTGIHGLDEILGGGFPQGRVLIILGEPGAGKTILCSQFLANGINKFGESGLFVSLEEGKTHFTREMAAFGWDFVSAEKEGRFTFVDASPIRTIPREVRIGQMTIQKQDFSLISLLEVIQNNAKAINARRIVVDPLSLLMFLYPEEAQRRKALLDLSEGLSETGATCILSSELRRVGSKARTMQPEEYLVHGVLLMQTNGSGKTMERFVQVEKMRESQIDRHPRHYEITERGIEVYPYESEI